MVPFLCAHALFEQNESLVKCFHSLVAGFDQPAFHLGHVVRNWSHIGTQFADVLLDSWLLSISDGA
jgi:hypothetical protein